MYTPQLEFCLKQLMKRKRGQYAVLPCDYLDTYEITTYPVLLIVNNEPSNENGRHWIAMYIKRLGAEVEFFCSYGRSISDYSHHFTDFVRRMETSSLENEKRIQGPFSTACGHFVVFFLYKRLRGCPLASIYCIFTNDYTKNEKIVISFVNRLPTFKFILSKKHQCYKTELN